ncbi:MAG: PrgI family protein [Patescibacteria group bacterium]
MQMNFVVPQFIEVESKVIGPISIRQFIILLVTAGFLWLFWTILTFWFAAIVDIFCLAVGGTFAFVKINSQPFHIFALCYVQTMRSPALKVWQRERNFILKKIEKKAKPTVAPAYKAVPTQSRLTELSLLVDTGGVYKPEELQDQVQQKLNSQSNK